MQEPLRDIFAIYEERAGSQPMTKSEQAVWDKAQAVLGDQWIDDLLHAQSRSLTEEQYASFRRGFRLGALLMLDVMD